MIAALLSAAVLVSPMQQPVSHQDAMVCDATFAVTYLLFTQMGEANPQDQQIAAGIEAAGAMMGRARTDREAAAAREGLTKAVSDQRTEDYALAHADAQSPEFQATLGTCMQRYGAGILSDIN